MACQETSEIISNSGKDVEQQLQQGTDQLGGTSTTSTASTAQGEEDDEFPPTLTHQLIAFYWKYEFLILIVTAIVLARAYPPIGAHYVQPDITATWIAVVLIFIFAGLTLKTEEFSKAFSRIYFNLTIQIFNFGFVSGSVFVMTLLLERTGILSQDLRDGMVACSCLPMTVNMAVVLTKASGGDEAAAVFNTASGNMMGVFLSPLLILGYLGGEGDVELFDVFYKLALRIVLPVCVGQLLQKTSKTAVVFVKKYKPRFKSFQQYSLVFLVYTIFSRTFEDDTKTSVSLTDIFIMICFQFVFFTLFLAISWNLLKVLFHDHPQLRAMGLFGCTLKSVAMGIPLINSIYGDSDAIGLYTLPLLVWYPMQLVIGTFLAPRLADFVAQNRPELDDESDVEGAVDHVPGKKENENNTE